MIYFGGKVFRNTLHLSLFSVSVITKKYSGCLIVSEIDIMSLVLPSDDATKLMLDVRLLNLGIAL